MYILQSCGFGGLWRFAGPFTKANNNAENVELFNNALEALVETCLPVDEMEEAIEAANAADLAEIEAETAKKPKRYFFHFELYLSSNCLNN